jgi:hypothetical protein
MYNIYFLSPYCFNISAAVCPLPLVPDADPALLAPLVVRVLLIEKPRLIVLAMDPIPLVPVTEPVPTLRLLPLATPNGDPFIPVLIANADPPLSLPLLLAEAVNELPDGGRAIAMPSPCDPGEKLPVPDPWDEVIAMAGAALPPGPPMGIPRECVEWEEATDAGLPREEGAKRGISRNVGDKVDREDDR